MAVTAIWRLQTGPHAAAPLPCRVGLPLLDSQTLVTERGIVYGLQAAYANGQHDHW